MLSVLFAHAVAAAVAPLLVSRWGRRAFYPLALVPLISLVWVATHWPTATRTETVHLSWVPELSMNLDLRFDWGRAPPMDVIPADRYSVRWDTCLTLDAPRTVPFQLTSDNRAKLFIDDKLVLQTQGKQLQARGAAIKLTAGVHSVRVEYTKVGRESHIGLTASLDGEPPQALPFSRLSAPRSAIDEPVVCD